MSGMRSDAPPGVLTPGGSVYFADRDDLLEKLDRMAVKAPGREKGRHTDDREHSAMRGYLRFLGGEDLLPLPVTLRKSAKNQDPPDFILEWSDGRRETFELTDGSTREYQARLTVAARTGETGLVLPVENPTPTRDAAELWATILYAAYLQKAAALRDGRFAIDHLLIYDLTGLNLLLPLDDGAPLLRDKIDRWLRAEQPQHRFRRVSVLRDLALLLDLTGDSRLLRTESPFFRLGVVRARDEDDLRRRLREIDRYCREHLIRRLKLFGSVLRKDLSEHEGDSEIDGFDAESDLDLLVEFEPGALVTLLDMARMERELGELIGIRVDLRTAGDLSRYFRREVVREAVPLHAE